MPTTSSDPTPIPPIPPDLQDPDFGKQADYAAIDALAKQYNYANRDSFFADFDKWLSDTTGLNVTQAQFYSVLDSELLLHGFLDPEWQEVILAILQPQNAKFLSLVTLNRPRTAEAIQYYQSIEVVSQDNRTKFGQASGSPSSAIWTEYMKAFSKKSADGTIDTVYESAFDFLSTDKKVMQYVNDRLTRDHDEPDPVFPWELRLGAARFLVPPININVSQTYKVGSMSGGALRQQTTPKFNSGYSETVIDMTLYFPNWESIWGVNQAEADTINFEPGGDTDQTIDKFLSSLRGLITAFKYAPFLPVKNQYLNEAWGITAVALSDLSVNTLENFPFCVSVNLTMLKFNHKVYLPVIEDFNEAINWGRYRQYMGRAAKKMVSTVDQGFLVQDPSAAPVTPDIADPGVDAAGNVTTPSGLSSDFGTTPLPDPVAVKYESDLNPNPAFNVNQDWNDGKNFEIYYPVRTPLQVFAPDDSYFRQPQEDYATPRAKDEWDYFMQALGFNVDDNIDAQFDNVQNYAKISILKAPENEKLVLFLKSQAASVDAFRKADLEGFIKAGISEYKDANGGQISASQIETITRQRRNVFFTLIFTGYRDTPFFKSYLQNLQFVGGKILLTEWLVPMAKMPFDWKYIFISGISVSLGNNLAKLQVQLQDEPVHQHIGGRDSRVDVSLVVFGEDELVKFRRVFDHIKGLARLEHAHGVLGFLGIKNVLTALCGIKYVLPLAYEVDTIPGFPHVYNVKLSFVDFDVFQQQKENLSTAQQRELVTAFGKRNPFLRIKQLWGSFNAYPDFPLSIRNTDLPPNMQIKNADGKVDDNAIVGHLEPDFYFRAFQTIDDEVAYMGHGILFAEFADLKTNADAQAKIADLEAWKTAVLDRPFHGQQQGDPDPRVDEAKQIDDKITYLQGRISASDNPTGALNPDFINTGSDFTDQVYGPYANVHSVVHNAATYGDGQDQVARIEIGHDMNLSLGKYNLADDTLVVNHTNMALQDESHQGTLTNALLPGNVPASVYMNPTINFSQNLTRQFQGMMLDSQYRDISGRMVRAFPTFMLWLIDEGGRFAGVKLFDNFYGLQSVLDFSLLQSEDILGDTLMLRVSNIYQKLTTPYKAYLDRTDGNAVVTDQDKNQLGQLIDRPFDVQRNLLSGTDPQYIVDIANIQLKPGVRVHLRAGYSANPNALQTIFNGTITMVEQGDIVTITAQSDAIELAPYVNSTNKKGDSGKIDGALNTGLWMSEPRDLMVRLLSMGSSTFKEGLAAATDGLIFSENRFGIRHFGNILYDPLNDDEQTKQDTRYAVINKAISGVTDLDQTPTNIGGSIASDLNPISAIGDIGFQAFGGAAATRSPVIAIVQGMWVNFFRKRDYELFKRNIYPGNGLGIAQYLGGDAGDGGVQIAMTAKAKGVVNKAMFPTDAMINQVNDPIVTQALNGRFAVPTVPPIPPTAATDSSGGQEGQGPTASDPVSSFVNNPVVNAGITAAADTSTLGMIMAGVDVAKSALSLVGNILTGKEDSPFLQALGIAGRDDDVPGFDEVSFRAQTYMKSVWDLFLLCAALQPNYIVSIRPFEDRSTVFYGKPHWLWTSAVIPVTTGVPTDGGPAYEKASKDYDELVKKLETNVSPLSDFEAQLKLIQHNEATSSPFSTSDGMPWTGGDVTGPNGLPHQMPRGSNGHTITLPATTGTVAEEMHLPTNGEHLQLDDLPPDQRFPLYQDASLSKGAMGGSEGLDPRDEQWYMNMRWDYGLSGSDRNPNTDVLDYKGARVLCRNTVTNLAVVCSIGDWGPGAKGTNGDRVAGLSPDAMWVTKSTTDNTTIFEFGFLSDSAPLGPVSALGGTQSQPGVAAADQTASTYVTINESIWDALSQPQKNALGGQFIDQGQGTASFTDNFSGDSHGGYVDYKLTDGGMMNFLKIDATKLSWYQWLQTNGVNSDAPNITSLNVNELVYLYGFDKGHNLAPVFLDPFIFATTATNTNQDDVGIAARKYYDATYAKRQAGGAPYTTPNGDTPNISVDTAQDIWNELRERALDVFFKHYIMVKFTDPVYKDIVNAATTKGLSPEDFWAGNDKRVDPYDGGGPKIPGHDSNPVSTHVSIDSGAQAAYELAVDTFLRFLWQSPFGRAYVVITAPHFDHGVLGLAAVSHGDDWDFENSALMDVWDYWIAKPDGLPPGLGQPMDITNNGSSNNIAGKQGSSNNSSASNTALLKFMENNIPLEGKTGTATEHITGVIDNTIGKWIKYIATALLGVVGNFRLSMAQLGEGLGMVSSMQKQANIMNKVLNDSIYYSAGPVGSLMWMVDNAFTREYGEPVVEVREPFQRVHYISSFQHILNNGIQQTIDNVPTVVTATSDGEYPVTVYFDKGLSSQKQVEATIETGLYWDNARGTGFFGFLHPLIHPIETLRSIIKEATGSSDELLSKRVALWHLKEGLKNIYQGEVIILGNPDIRPHDLVYIADVYERMYGMFEVEQIVHHFTPEQGFITSITPNAMVTINDPARWSMVSWMWSWWSVKSTRDSARTYYFGSQGTNATINKGDVGFDDLENALEPTLLGSTQYTHGNSALIRDLAAYRGIGLLGEPLTQTEIDKLKTTGVDLGSILGNLGSVAAGLVIPGFYAVQDFWGDTWDWFRENLVDQHNCYIQFLTKDGVPMDAGLSYNQGVAVGTHYSTSLLPGILGLPINIRQDGHARITTNDLMKSLGWSEMEVSQISRDTSWWINQTNAQILDLSGTGPSNDALQLGFGKIPTRFITVSDTYFDGDTFTALDSAGHTERYRLNGINTPEIIHTYPDVNPPQFESTKAREYLRKRIFSDPIAEGYQPTVVIRDHGPDATGARTLATVFHNVPKDTPTGVNPSTGITYREEVLTGYASKTPLVPWDSYLDDGRPYTVNWEMIMKGFSQTILYSVSRNNPDLGAIGLGR